MTRPAKDPGATYLRALVGVSALLVLTTLLFRYRTQYFLWLAPVSLGEENVFAAWFSGTLLLLASLHAADGFFRLRHTDRSAAYAWCVVAAMLLFLSADEIACLHERIEHFSTGPILSFVPFVVVLVGGCAWSFLRLWLTPSERPRVIGLMIGFGLLMSVGVQEIIERILELPWYLRPVRTAIEEGSELAGILVLIYTMLPNSRGLFCKSADAPAFSSTISLRWFLIALAVVIAWPLAQLTASMDEQADLGHYSDWMSCVLLTKSAAMLVANWARSASHVNFPATGVALLCAASALCVQFDPIGNQNIFPGSSTIRAFGADLNTRLVLLALCCLGTAESLRTKGPGYRAGAPMMASVGVLAAVCSVYSTPDALWWGYFATSLVAIGAFASMAALTSVLHRLRSAAGGLSSRPPPALPAS